MYKYIMRTPVRQKSAVKQIDHAYVNQEVQTLTRFIDQLTSSVRTRKEEGLHKIQMHSIERRKRP